MAKQSILVRANSAFWKRVNTARQWYDMPTPLGDAFAPWQTVR